MSVTGSERYRLLLALRKAPHAHAVYPFGAELHYTDDRASLTPDRVIRESTAYVKSEGFDDATAHPISAGIEDSFMELMGSPVQQAS